MVEGETEVASRTVCIISCKRGQTKYELIKSIITTFLPLGVFLLIFGLFGFTTVLEVTEGDERFEEELEFQALLYIIIPSSIILVFCGGYLYIGCSQLKRGCLVNPRTDDYNNSNKIRTKRVGLRSLEWLDLGTDIISAIIIFPDFNQAWKVIIISSILLTTTLNLYIYFVLDKDMSYKGRKRKNALSFAILGAEDVVMIPLTYLYLQEEIEAGSISQTQENAERVAVGMSIAIGLLLLILRAGALGYIICFALPDPPLSQRLRNENEIEVIARPLNEEEIEADSKRTVEAPIVSEVRRDENTFEKYSERDNFEF